MLTYPLKQEVQKVVPVQVRQPVGQAPQLVEF